VPANQPQLTDLLQGALEARFGLFDERHMSAMRLFNGFYEGYPQLVADIYASTLLLTNYADPPDLALAPIQIAQEFYLENLPWVKTVVLKNRKSKSVSARNGQITYGQTPARRINEAGVWYAIDLQMNQDASFYLDTRNLRSWLRDNLSGKTVLNAFAYTGSLGVAARAGGARQVVHLDLNRKFLNIGKESYSLNGFPINKMDFQRGDFWSTVNRLKRAGERFDCVIIDPPFFSATKKGSIDMLAGSHKVINKVRPVVTSGGYLVVINNALFLSGAEYLETIKQLCEGGYLKIAEIIPVPEDITGYPHTLVRPPPVDPAPFNHPTKIVLLQVKHKDRAVGL
jgi:23S rRNA (cytosine1962-C5)-methyltransferase